MNVVLKFLLLLIAIKLFFLAIIFFLVDNNWIEVPMNHSKVELIQKTGWYRFVLIVLIGPLLEESMFRLALVFKPVYISISCAILYLYLYSFYMGVQLDSFDFLVTRVLTASLLFLLVYSVCLRYTEFLSSLWRKRSTSMVLMLSFLFGFFHLVNYEVQRLSFLSIMVIVIPYFISGLIYSHIRLQHNFRLAVLTHFLFNGLGFLLTQVLFIG
ncbi:CPBP family glutamic-type intramembrane protease [Myroides fluvii]|uniref:CPBP family glutamic-type intramembrane protease n=1 Tax=Myroides fluvii TaxID=2572594 RepID=UPI00131BA4AF|nr:CPBP family glutamic-type intramembrane protease [Myroides fluvii]